MFNLIFVELANQLKELRMSLEFKLIHVSQLLFWLVDAESKVDVADLLLGWIAFILELKRGQQMLYIDWLYVGAHSVRITWDIGSLRQ